MKFISLLLFSAMVIAAQDSSQQLPTAQEVVARMMEHDNQREAAFRGYTAGRRYTLENARHHKRAEMVVTVRCLDDGSKQFQTVSAIGWGAVRNHVFPKLLETESESSRPDFRERSRITPANYTFQVLKKDYINQRPAYVMAIVPKSQNKYLVEGNIWVDADEYAIVRIEGRPAKNPSYWIKSVHFVHTYRKSGFFWFPESDRSVTEVRFLGANNLTIEYFAYQPNVPALSASREAATEGRP